MLLLFFIILRKVSHSVKIKSQKKGFLSSFFCCFLLKRFRFFDECVIIYSHNYMKNLKMTIEYTKEYFEKENGNGYKAEDNRTYIDSPLSTNPSLDIAYHIAAPKADSKGNSVISTLFGTFLGNIYEETYRKASQSVFSFTKATHFKDNVKSIVTADLPMLFTTWHIERYNIVKNFTYRQQTNIYYDVKGQYFFVAMDERFFDKFETSEIYYPEDNKNEKIKAKIKNTKDNKELLIIYADTIEELKKEIEEDGNTFDVLHKRYKERFLNLQDLEKVIVLRYETDNQDSIKSKHSGQFHITNNRCNDAINFIIRQNMKMEMFQAAKTDDGFFYLIDENTGQIQTKAIVYIDENKTSVEYIQNEKNSSQYHLHSGGDTFLIMPYFEDDWNLLKAMQEKLHAVCRDLEAFLQASKTGLGELDKPISQVSAIGQSQLFLPSK